MSASQDTCSWPMVHLPDAGKTRCLWLWMGKINEPMLGSRTQILESVQKIHLVLKIYIDTDIYKYIV